MQVYRRGTNYLEEKKANSTTRGIPAGIISGGYEPICGYINIMDEKVAEMY